jgi:hypothetical protein
MFAQLHFSITVKASALLLCRNNFYSGVVSVQRYISDTRLAPKYRQGLDLSMMAGSEYVIGIVRWQLHYIISSN